MKIRANAKINLSLEICGKRQDGYHSIDTVMHSVGIYDLIEIKKADTITVCCDSTDISQHDNIAYKAAVLFFEDFKVDGGAFITVKKNIPLSAGLGGGSADAAAVLLGLRKLYNAKIKNSDLEKTALKLGADVPFFIEGGCKRGKGVGEIFTNIKPLEKGYFLLCKAEEKSSTGDMYRILDSKDYGKCDTEAVINAIKQNDLKALGQNIYNAFAEIWQQSFVKKAIENQSPLAVSLSGSGPTWFAIYENEKDALKAKSALESQNIQCFLTIPQSESIIFE